MKLAADFFRVLVLLGRLIAERYASIHVAIDALIVNVVAIEVRIVGIPSMIVLDPQHCLELGSI